MITRSWWCSVTSVSSNLSSDLRRWEVWGWMLSPLWDAHSTSPLLSEPRRWCRWLERARCKKCHCSTFLHVFCFLYKNKTSLLKRRISWEPHRRCLWCCGQKFWRFPGWLWWPGQALVSTEICCYRKWWDQRSRLLLDRWGCGLMRCGSRWKDDALDILFNKEALSGCEQLKGSAAAQRPTCWIFLPCIEPLWSMTKTTFFGMRGRLDGAKWWTKYRDDLWGWGVKKKLDQKMTVYEMFLIFGLERNPRCTLMSPREVSLLTS